MIKEELDFNKHTQVITCPGDNFASIQPKANPYDNPRAGMTFNYNDFQQPNLPPFEDDEQPF
jgi:hypothetical protein